MQVIEEVVLALCWRPIAVDAWEPGSGFLWRCGNCSAKECGASVRHDGTSALVNADDPLFLHFNTKQGETGFPASSVTVSPWSGLTSVSWPVLAWACAQCMETLCLHILNSMDNFSNNLYFKEIFSLFTAPLHGYPDQQHETSMYWSFRNCHLWKSYLAYQEWVIGLSRYWWLLPSRQQEKASACDLCPWVAFSIYPRVSHTIILSHVFYDVKMVRMP